MEVKQVYELVNQTSQEVLGETAVVQEDLSNLVDIGEQVLNMRAVENYARTLVDHIGKMVFVNRPYTGRAPRVLMDAWEFGAILEKVRADMPEAEENETWELQDRQVYEQDMFYKPTVRAKFFDRRVTFEVPMSFGERQMKSAFSGPEQMNAFVSMIYTAIENSMTVKLDSLIMRTINNYIGEVMTAAFPTGNYTGAGNTQAINLLARYNTAKSKTLTVNQAMGDADFLRFASETVMNTVEDMHDMSVLYNLEGNTNHTPADRMHLVMLSRFYNAARVNLYSDTFHDAEVRLPDADLISAWQGSGPDGSFNNRSDIDIVTASGKTFHGAGILGVCFDRDALGVSNLERYTRTHVNDKAEFINNWAKMIAGYFNDLGENFVVFFIA